MITPRTVILIILILLIIGAMPTWGYSRNWGFGWYPPLGLVIIVILILLLL